MNNTEVARSRRRRGKAQKRDPWCNRVIEDFEKGFVLATDASDIAVLAVLNQRVNGELTPVAYYSRLLSLAERR